MEETTKRAIGYGRVSTDEQQKSGTSLVDQYAGNHEKARQLGMPMAAYFEDADSGGFYLTRAGLQDALKYLEDGKANVLICKDLVRLTRNDRAEQSQILKRIKDAGAQLVFWDVTYENSPLGEFSLNVTGDFAILEKAIIKDRTMRGRRRRAAEGVMPARTIAPFGYKIPTKQDIIRGTYPPELLGKYLLDKERAPIAAEIFQRYAVGESLHGICRWLQSSGVATVAGGRFWRPSNLYVILANPAYYGKAAFGRSRMVTDEARVLQGFKKRTYEVPVPESEWIRIDCPAIISKEVWDRCQQNRQENRERLSTRPTYRLILTGLLRCPQCKRVMTGRAKSSNFVSHYKCKEANPGSNSARVHCWPKNINAKRLDSLVIEAVKTVVHHPSAVEIAYQTYHALLHSEYNEQEYQNLKRQLSELNAEEIATAKAQIQGIAAGANSTVYETLLRELALKRTRLQERISELEKLRMSAQTPIERATIVRRTLEEVEAVLESSESVVSNHEKNQLLGKVIASVYPDLDGNRFTITFRGFDDGTQLIAEVEKGKPPVLRVVDEFGTNSS